MHYLGEVGVAAQEARREAAVDAEHVVHHEHLPVCAPSGSDSDCGYGELGRDLGGELGRYLLEHNREAAYLLQKLCVGNQFAGFLLFAGADAVGAELVDALRGKAQVAHHGDAGAQDALHRLPDFGTTLHLDCLGMALLHDAYGRGECLLGVPLVGTEGEVYHHEGAFYGLHHRFGVIYHLVEGDGECRHVARHDVGGGVAHQDDVYSRLIDDFGRRVVVGGEHRDFLTALLHLHQAARGHFP